LFHLVSRCHIVLDVLPFSRSTKSSGCDNCVSRIASRLKMIKRHIAIISLIFGVLAALCQSEALETLPQITASQFADYLEHMAGLWDNERE